MPSDSKDFKIQIETTATGDGAKKTEEALKGLNKEADTGKQKLSFYEEGLRAAEKAATDAGNAATTAAGTGAAGSGIGIAAIAAAGAVATGAMVALRESIAGLNKVMPTLGASLGGIGKGIRDAFQEVMGGSLRTALQDLFGSDFEARLQRIAESFGAMTARMKLMSEASADFIAKQRTLVELINEEAQARERAATATKNRYDELEKEIELQKRINKAQDEEDKAAIERDPRRTEGAKMRDKDWVDTSAEYRDRMAQIEASDARAKEIDARERSAAVKYNQADEAAKAAEAMSRGDYSKAGALPAEQRQQVQDAMTKVAGATTPEAAEKARDELAKLLKVFEEARIKAQAEFEKQVEDARHKREIEDQRDREEEAAYDRKQRERERTAPAKEAAAEIGDTKSEIAAVHGQNVAAAQGIAEALHRLETDPAFGAKDTEGKAKAALESIAARLKTNAEDQRALADLSQLLQQLNPQVTTYGQEIIQGIQSQLQTTNRSIEIMRDLIEKQKQQQQQLEDLKSRVDAL